MTKLAAIEGQLVSIKNVSTHKSACLTIHIPEEYALKVIEAFGWPTMVAPVHVAIARMGVAEPEPEVKPTPETKSDKAKRKWDELSIAQQAGIMCNEIGFQKFVAERKGIAPQGVITVDDAATYVRQLCGVNSRANIEGKPDAEKKFRNLRIEYDNWLRVPA
jgi:hypothetical protein